MSAAPVLSFLPEFADVAEAARRIEGHVHRTPVLTSRSLNADFGAELFFKCENLQRVGAFKARGAANAVLALDPDVAARGVATHSSGNHGAALALAAATRGVPAWVVVPQNAPAVKRAAVVRYGATVVDCAPTLAARESTLETVVAKTGATLVHPYDDALVIAGQGTAALELLEDVPGLDLVIAPVGGGGLISGTALAARACRPEARVYAAEPAAADDAQRSLASGQRVRLDAPKTIADGLRASIGERNFALMQQLLDGVILAEEAAILPAMQTLWERLKLVLEPSAAVPLAALNGGGLDIRDKRVGIILTGGNVDLEALGFRR
jgi:threonine dehydratase